MIFKLLFVRRSNSSFKIYVLERHKICSFVLSAQLTGFRFGSNSIADVFVKTSFNRYTYKYFRDMTFFNNCVAEFLNFVQYARARKIL